MTRDQSLDYYRELAAEDVIDLEQVARTLWGKRILLAAITGVGVLGTGAFSLTLPNVFTATTTLMPADTSGDRLSSALSSLGAMGGLAAQAGVGIKASASDKLVALLGSRTLAEEVLRRHDLLPALFPALWDERSRAWRAPTRWFFFGPSPQASPDIHEGADVLRAMVSSRADLRSSVVTVDVLHADPGTAAKIANAYTAELKDFLQDNSFTSARRNKDFLVKQVAGIAQDLTDDELQLKTFQEEHRLVSLDAQTQAAVQEYASIKSQLTAKEIELDIQGRSASPEDVQVVGLRREIGLLREHLKAIENRDSGGGLALRDAPKLTMKYARLKRDLMAKQQIFEVLSQQLELAKLEETKETITFQVIDRAIPPREKSKPHRLLLVFAAAVISFLAAASFVLGADHFRSRVG